MPVRDHVEGLALALQEREVVQGPDQMADVQGARGLDAGQDAVHGNSGKGADQAWRTRRATASMP